MVARIPMPRLIEHNETGATIVFGWHSGDVIRYDIHCECGTTRFDLIAREPVNPEHYLWAAAEYHHELWSDCECLKGSEEFKAHLN